MTASPSNSKIRDEAVAWFVRLQVAEAGEGDWLAFRDWLEADAEHRAAYDDVESLWVDLDKVDPVEPSPAVVAFPTRPAPAPRRRKRPALAWFAAIAASLVVGVAVWPMLQPQIEALGVKTETYRTAPGQPRDINLADGSRIYLNGGSELSVRMEPSRRALALTEGEAAFDVTHDPSRPFEVDAGDRSVRVLGTEFNVLRHDDKLTVTVRRGVVAVNDESGQGVRLKVGDQLVHPEGSSEMRVQRVDPDGAFAWRQGLLVYQDRPLGEVASDLRRYVAKPIQVEPSAAALRFTGVLRVAEEDGMVKRLEAFLPVTAEQTATEIRLRARDHRQTPPG